MYKSEMIATKNGFSVKNGSTITQVINQDGTLNGGSVIDDSSITSAKLASNSVITTKITDANVTLAKLAAGITPSHVVKYAGKITWSGAGATLATTVAGVAATDIVNATIQTAPTQAAYIVSVTPTANTITTTLSAANTSNNAVIAYEVLRVAA